MPEERYVTETLKYYTEVFRLVWVSMLAIGGGSVGLLLGERSVVKVILGLTGIFSVVILLEILRRLNRQIAELLKKLKEAKNA
jgi:hypothetical protein